MSCLTVAAAQIACDEVCGTAPGMLVTQKWVTPSSTYVGSFHVVPREVSKQPPWSMATSTSTAPGCMVPSCARVTSLGAAAPGISTAPITMSAVPIRSAVAATLEYCVVRRPMKMSSR